MRQKTGLMAALAALGLVGAGGAAGCGNSAGANAAHKADAGSTAAPTEVKATLSEFHIATSTPNAHAGRVTFTATNAGKTEHELIVIRTDKQAADLGKGSRISEAGSVGEVSGVAPGQTKSSTLDLKPGHYALICNMPGHYMGGMHTDLTVS